MRSRVVPKGDMFAKYGVEVRDFPYAFVLTRSGAARDDRSGCDGNGRPSHPPPPALVSGKSPSYIEVKFRAVR